MDQRTRRCLDDAEKRLAGQTPDPRTGAVVLAVFRVWLEDIWTAHQEEFRRHIKDEVPEIHAELARQSRALFGDDNETGLVDLKRQICVASRWAAGIATILGTLVLWGLHVLHEVAAILNR